MHPHPFDISPLSQRIWEDKYQFSGMGPVAGDQTVEDTWRRVANAAASVEAGGAAAQQKWADTFYEAMADFVFLPAGRIVAGAGTERDVTLFNCFVMGTIGDDLGDIFAHVREAALTMQKGGGIGHDFSTLRPKGALVRSIGSDASGPVSFMDVWDSMCRTIMSAGARRGAMMGTLRCDHPDIELFVAAKADPARLRNFNVSVLVPDTFIQAVRADADWDLVFNDQVYKTVRARKLWEDITRATYDYAEPGVIFIDQINARNNLSYCESIQATNPCGEQPLPPYGACLLGSINLARLVTQPFTTNAAIDAARLEAHVRTAVRLLDNVIDVSRYPLAAQEQEAKAKRRIGLGMTGLADALIFCGLSYDSAAARKQAETWMSAIQNAAYRASAELAAEKGAFALYEREAFLRSPNVARLDNDVQAAIARDGIRNGCLTSIAPTGTISLLAGNVSSGIEPVFATQFERRVLEADGASRTETVSDYAAAVHAELFPDADLPRTFVTSNDLSVSAHLEMQSAVQKYVDSSISKTINCPADIPFEDFRDVYLKAFDLGLKGCTTFRPNAVTGAVLSAENQPAGSDATVAEAAYEPPLTQPVEAVGVMVEPAARDTRQPTNPANRAGSTARDGVVLMTEPLERDLALAGHTYKLKWPGSAHAIYITINDIERDGRRRPFEVFINTKNLEHQPWTVALTRMISAVFRRGGDVSFVVEELRAIYDPQGGQWVNGRYVPSLLAAIGDIVETHMVKTGFLAVAPETAKPFSLSLADNSGGTEPISNIHSGLPDNGSVNVDLARTTVHEPPSSRMTARFCPQCGSDQLQAQEGCLVCRACGYAHCG